MLILLFQINEMRPAAIPDFERDYHESLLIVLDTLEKCLSMQANLHPSAHGHNSQGSHPYLSNRAGIGRGPAYQGLKMSRPGANAAANVSAALQGSLNNHAATGESVNSTKERDGNASTMHSAPQNNVTSSVVSNSCSSGSSSSTQPSTQKYDEIMNVKLLLKEICQFLDMPNNDVSVPSSSCSSPSNNMPTNLLSCKASKVLFALSINNFGAVFSRISGRLQELSVDSGGRGDGGGDRDPGEYTDIELIQHIDVDIVRLTKLLNEAISKFRILKKGAQLVI